ncbi:hypothetical protein ACWFNE_03540 [Cellulomonas sp. NPDC055163]
MEALLAAAEGEYAFDVESLASAALTRWPTSRFVRYDGQQAAFGYGQLQIPDETGDDALLVDLLAGGTGFNLERSPEVAAEFIAWVTGHADFPEGSVALFGWAGDPLTLRTNMSAEELSASFEG